MKHTLKILLLLPVLLVAGSLRAQPVKTVDWSVASRAVGDSLYEVTFTGEILDGWHTYDLRSGFSSTRIEMEPSAGVTLDGALAEAEPAARRYDELLNEEIGEYADRIVLVQRVKLSGAAGRLAGKVTWISCRGTQCNMPEEWAFDVALGDDSASSAASSEASGGESAVASDATVEPAAEAAIGGNSAAIAAPAGDGSLWSLVLAAVGWGLLALLTPCVFPMIPMTVSFFLKGSATPAAGRAKALLYGLFIVALYTLPIAAIILVTRVVGGEAVTADIFNWIATHWLPNVIFFVVFMLFAASFFGAFELTLPGWMVNRSDRNADRGGLLGLFFMALTLVLVSFSCTGPIVGSAIIGATSGAFWAPILTMLVFSLTFALPFTLFAMFPSMLRSLPKSGGWLNAVKVTLGFIEVALGFKFLSVADQTYHWGLLDREVYLAVWIVCFSLLGLYLLGKLRFAHDSELKHITVPRLALAIASFTFVVYMIPGMWGAPLKALSGYLPPMTTQDFVLGRGGASPIGGADGPTSVWVSDAPQVKYGDLLHASLPVTTYFEFDEALAAARAAGRPLLVDVTGHGCVNCREMNDKVLSDPRVVQLLRDGYVFAELYTDDKARALEEDWVTLPDGAQLREIGRINAYIVRTRFGVNAQPNYIVVDGEGRQLLPARGYDLSVEGYVAFLEEGLRKFAENR